MELLFDYLTGELKLESRAVAESLRRDYRRGGRSDQPVFLRKFLPADEPRAKRGKSAALKRQARHLAG